MRIRYYLGQLIKFAIERFTRFRVYEDTITSTVPYFYNKNFLKAKNDINKMLKNEVTIDWRLHTFIFFALNQIKSNQNPLLVEFGVGKGLMLKGLISYDPYASFSYIGIDTFLPYYPDQEGNQFAESSTLYESYANSKHETEKNFSSSGSIKFLQGQVPDILDRITVEDVVFCHIDMNSAKPELAALEFIFPRMKKGGYILLDDFAWHDHKDQGIALAEFAHKKNIQILTLQTGQGLIIK